MFTCPVCGYDRLNKPPMDYLICPCCGTEFGYSDSGPEPVAQIHAELRAYWLNHGSQWHSRAVPQPLFWNPYFQLINANLAAGIPWLVNLVVTVPTTYTSVRKYSNEYEMELVA
jgi:hypothetical protein